MLKGWEGGIKNKETATKRNPWYGTFKLRCVFRSVVGRWRWRRQSSSYTMSTEPQIDEPGDLNMDKLKESLEEIKESMSSARKVIRTLNERCVILYIS